MTPVYVLHCSEMPERTTKCQDHLRERGVKATFVRGYHGNTWGLDTRLEFDPGKRISPAHVGLNLGIWGLWNHLDLTTVKDPAGQGYYGAGPDDEVVTLEDDAVVPHNFPAIISDLKIELNYHFADWDLVFLGLAQTEPHVWNNVTERLGPPNSRLCRLNDPFGTHAIMLRRRALPILLDHMTRAERNLDQQLWQRVLAKGLLKWCAVLPSIVTQRTFDYTHSGRPEWAASTLDPMAPRHVAMDTAQAVDLAGGKYEPPGKPSAERISATTALVDRYACIYRGESLDDSGETVGTGKRRTVPLFQCARHNAPCHTKTDAGDVVTQSTARPVIACQPCPLRSEMASSAARDRLPLPDGHFNPSMLWWQGKLILATRDSWGHSKVALWELTNARLDWSGVWSVKPIASLASQHPDAPRLEDPRLFIARNPETWKEELCCMFSLPDGYPPKRVQVGYVRFAHDLQTITETVVMRSPEGNLYEKNWSPISDDDGLHWVYGTKPQHIVLGDTQNWATPNPLPWCGGVIRGGAAPVLVKANTINDSPRDEYYHFFHGCLKRLEGSVYTIGCSVFEARPPYKVLRQTAKPLVWPDLPAVGEDVVKRSVVFPGGAVAHAKHWHIAAGIDDYACRIFRIPFDTVEAELTDVPEVASGTSLRESPMALGQKEQ